MTDELKRSPEPVEWKPEAAPSESLMKALDHLLSMPDRRFIGEGPLSKVERLEPEVVAAYRRGLKRALEIVDGRKVVARSHSAYDITVNHTLDEAAAAIRAELAAHTPTPEDG